MSKQEGEWENVHMAQVKSKQRDFLVKIIFLTYYIFTQ